MEINRKKLKIICWATPFIVFALSTLLVYTIHEDTTTWEDNLVVKEISNPFIDIVILNVILSLSLFAVLFHLFKKIRESMIFSFITFFWPILGITILCTIFGDPLIGIVLLIWAGGFPFVVVLVLAFIIFRICINRICNEKTRLTNFEERTIEL